MNRKIRHIFALLVLSAATSACGQRGEPVRITVPAGASFGVVADSLGARHIVRGGPFFKLYARLRGATSSIKPGTYEFRRGTSWKRILEDLQEGRVLRLKLVIPEGWDLSKIAPRLADVTGLKQDTVLKVLLDSATARRYQVPGPSLEGYLYPATYNLGVRVPLDTVLRQLVQTYARVWTPARRARADSIGMSEREIVTLASIIEKEAKKAEEMPVISAVYHNRLQIGIPLQADPTVQYALGRHQARLLYAQIDSVADNPYNTYRRRGLPPGPIASPSERAIEAALRPAPEKFLYFVARPDGTHAFTRTLLEHNRMKLAIRREAAAAAAAAAKQRR